MSLLTLALAALLAPGAVPSKAPERPAVTNQASTAESDLATVLNPNWPVMADHIGPEAKQAVRDRVLADLPAYGAAFRRFLAAEAPWRLAVSRLTHFPELVAERDAALAQALRAELATALDRAAAAPLQPEQRRHLDAQRAELAATR